MGSGTVAGGGLFQPTDDWRSDTHRSACADASIVSIRKISRTSMNFQHAQESMTDSFTKWIPYGNASSVLEIRWATVILGPLNLINLHQNDTSFPDRASCSFSCRYLQGWYKCQGWIRILLIVAALRFWVGFPEHADGNGKHAIPKTCTKFSVV